MQFSIQNLNYFPLEVKLTQIEAGNQNPSYGELSLCWDLREVNIKQYIQKQGLRLCTSFKYINTYTNV